MTESKSECNSINKLIKFSPGWEGGARAGYKSAKGVVASLSVGEGKNQGVIASLSVAAGRNLGWWKILVYFSRKKLRLLLHPFCNNI